MVQSQQVKRCGMKVVNIYSVFSRVVAKLVRRADACARFDPASRKLDSEGSRMMIATQVFRSESLLIHWRASELAAPDDQSRLQQTALA